MTDEAPKWRPFHETVIDAIGGISSIYDLHLPAVLGKLIKETKIPEGHEAIAAAWTQRFEELHRVWGQAWDEDDYLGVVANLLEQKEEAAKKAEEKAKAKEAVPS